MAEGQEISLTPESEQHCFLTREEQIEHILAEVASGRSLWDVIERDDGMPGHSTFWRWHMADEDLRDNLARARENGVEVHLEQAVYIADTPQMGSVVTIKPRFNERGEPVGDVEEVRQEDMLGHRKLQIETRIKRAQMIAPRKYGPKMDLTSGGDKLPGPADPGDIATRMAAIVAAGQKRKDEHG